MKRPYCGQVEGGIFRGNGLFPSSGHRRAAVIIFLFFPDDGSTGSFQNIVFLIPRSYDAKVTRCYNSTQAFFSSPELQYY
jgi:hypothetical protein